MKIMVTVDERYPDRTVKQYKQGTRVTPPEVVIDVDQETFERWLRTVKAYDDMQEEIKGFMGR